MIGNMRDKLEQIIYDKYVNDPLLMKNDILWFVSELKDKIIIDRVVGIFKGDTLVQTLKEEELYWITKKLKEKYNDGELSLEKYFTPAEITRLDKFELISELKINKRFLVFENVIEINKGIEWLVPILTPEKIVEMNDNTLLNYNVNTQRPSITEVTRYGTERIRININKESVRSIKNEMKSNTYSNNEIKINALETGRENVEFIPYEEGGTLGRLRIEIDHQNGKEANLIDGMHRYTAILEAIRELKAEGKKVQTKLSARIHRVNETKAIGIIGQQNKQNPFEEETKSYYDVNDDYTIIVEKISAEMGNDSLLGGRIGRLLDEVLATGDFTTYEILTSAIKREYEVENTVSRNLIRDHVIDCLNMIVSTLAEEESDREPHKVRENRKNSFMFEPELFNGYIHLSKLVEDKPRMTTIIHKVIKSIDFDKKDGDFAKAGIKHTKSNRERNKMIENINKVFKKKLSELE